MPLQGRTLSRTALHVYDRGGYLAVHQANGAPCRVNGRKISKARLDIGDRIALGDDVLLLLVRRPKTMQTVDYPDFEFGRADAFGLVGESVTAWDLRRDLAFFGARAEHALVHGPPGVGKSVVARALHGVSDRARGPVVVRSSATIAPEWTTRELFGTAQGFPSPDDVARRGLLCEADGGALVLDDLDCASDSLQTQLLGVMDRGEYHRPGEATSRLVDVRVIGVTNRPDDIRRDLRSRFMLDVSVPSFGAWREDIPLLIRHLMKQHHRANERDDGRFFLDGEPRAQVELIDRLLDHAFTDGVRELSRLTVHAMATSRGAEVALTPSVVARLTSATPELPGRDDVLEALERNGGNVSQTWKDLGLTSRHVLNRLIRRYGLSPRRNKDPQ